MTNNNLVQKFFESNGDKSSLTPEEVKWLDTGLAAHVQDPTDPEVGFNGSLYGFEKSMQHTRNHLLDGELMPDDKSNLKDAIWYVDDVFAGKHGDKSPEVKEITDSLNKKLEDGSIFGKLTPECKAEAKKAISGWNKTFGITEGTSSINKTELKWLQIGIESYVDPEEKNYNAKNEKEVKALHKHLMNGEILPEDESALEAALWIVEGYIDQKDPFHAEEGKNAVRTMGLKIENRSIFGKLTTDENDYFLKRLGY